MATREQNKLARRIYSVGFDGLTGGEKSNITKKLKAQIASSGTGVSASGAVIAEIGVVGNGVKKCILTDGSTVEDLLNQSNLMLDKKKESILAKSTGNNVNLSDTVKNGEIYIITPEIKSA